MEGIQVVKGLVAANRRLLAIHQFADEVKRIFIVYRCRGLLG